MSSPFLELLALTRGEDVPGRAIDALVRRCAKDDDSAQAQWVDLITRPEWYVDQLVGRTPRLTPLLIGAGDACDEALADRQFAAYLRAALTRAHIDELRRHVLHNRLLASRLADAEAAGELFVVAGARDDVSLSELGAPPPELDTARRSARAWATLEHALDVVVADRGSEEPRATFAELVACARGDVELRALVAAGASSAADARRRYDARTKAHSRLRAALVEALDTLEAVGAIVREDADIGRLVVTDFLTRRPTSTRPSVLNPESNR